MIEHQVITRLSRGPAAEGSLARWCDVHVRAARPVLERMRRAGCIRDLGGRYALPFNPLSPAATVAIGRGFHWPMPGHEPGDTYHIVVAA